MKAPTEQRALSQVFSRLNELLDEPVLPSSKARGRKKATADGTLRVGPFTFVVEWRGSPNAAAIAAAAEHLRQSTAATREGVVPLVAVPYMGPTGQQLCQDAGVGWLDLSGNARVMAPGLRIVVQGEPNRFKHPGRPSSVLAPKSARVARWLLMHPAHAISQRELARSTALGEGFVSRIIARLEQDQLIARESDGRVRVINPDVLLDAWREVYDFSKHDIIRGHVAARSSEALTRRLAEALQQGGHRYAATGLAGAWLVDGFAGFRTVTLFLAEVPDAPLLEALSFREEGRGANVWLVVPNDEGVFQGAADHDGIQCAHPVQVYLDLKAQPERAAEAAQHLRARRLRWRSDA